MKREELLRHLRWHGCELLREGAKHSWWYHPSLNTRSAVPRHTEITKSSGKQDLQGSQDTYVLVPEDHLFINFSIIFLEAGPGAGGFHKLLAGVVERPAAAPLRRKNIEQLRIDGFIFLVRRRERHLV